MCSIIIGVDGGGTKTRVSAVDAGGRIIAGSEGASINYNNIGVDKAFSNFKYIMEDLHIDYAKIRAVSIGDPAQDDICVNPHTENFTRKIRTHLPLGPMTEIYIKSDVYMALYGLTQGKAGALIVSGTGSMGAAIDENGGFYVAGGGGFPINDTGSGYDIAVAAFQYIFDAFDKFGYRDIAKTGGMLSAAALDYYGVSHPRELINCFHGEHNSRARVAEFSKIVYLCAERGCKEAVRILEKAGQKLAECGVRLIGRMNYPPEGCPLIGIYGSVLTNNHFVRDSFDRGIRLKYPLAEIKEAQMPPEYAAVIYAKRMIEQR